MCLSSINMINIVSILFLCHMLSAPVSNGHIWIGEAAAPLQQEHKTRPPPPCHLQSVVPFWGVGYQNIRRLMAWWCHWLRRKHVQKGRDRITEALMQTIWGVHIWQRTETCGRWIAQLSGGRCNVALCWPLCHQSGWSSWSVQRPAAGCLTIWTSHHFSSSYRVLLSWWCFLVICTWRLFRPVSMWLFLWHTGALRSPPFQGWLWLVLVPCLKCQRREFTHAALPGRNLRIATEDARGARLASPPSFHWEDSDGWSVKLWAHLRDKLT